MNNIMLHSGYPPPPIHSAQPATHSSYNNVSRAASANEGLTARITGPGTSPHFLAAASGRPTATAMLSTHSSASIDSQPGNNIDSAQSSNQAVAPPVPRPLTVHEQEMIAQLDKLKYFLATAPSRWSAPNSSAPDALVQHPQSASHPAMNRFLLPSGEFVSCVLWGGLYHITGTDIVRALVFRFDAFARPVRNMKKFEEGVFSDLRNLKPGNDACLEEPKSPFLDLLFKYQCIRTQKKQKVFYWFSVPHDRLFLDALERDLKREKMGLEPTTVVVGEPARSFTYDPKRTLYEQFVASRGGEGDELDRAMRAAERLPEHAYLVSNKHEPALPGPMTKPATLALSRKLESDAELNSDVEATPEPRSRAGTQQPSNAINNQSGHGKQFFNMLSLFEGSPSYKQRRKKVVKPTRRRLASGGTGTESESEAGVGLRFIDRDVASGPVNGLDLTQNMGNLTPDHMNRPLVVQDHIPSRANSLALPHAARQSPYAQDPAIHGTVAVPSVSLRQHQPEVTNGLNGNVDGLISAPHVSSSLRSDISQQLTQVSPDLRLQYHASTSALPNTNLGAFDAPNSIAATGDIYATQPPQDASSGLVPCTKAYVCPLYSCGRLYREPGYLRDHIRSHTTDKPYPCERCYKKFSRTDLLTQHHQTHARADNGDPQAHHDLERADEEETMLMGEKICEVEVRGEVEDVAGEPGQLRGIGVVCIYPSSNADQAIVTNPVDDYAEVAASPPPSNFPYPGIVKHSPNAHWRSQHGVGSARSVPSARWPTEGEPWEVPRSQSALGYAWDQRSVSPAYSAISAPISHAPYHRSNTTDSLRPPLGYMQSAPSHKQSFDAPAYIPNHPGPAALRRHRSATPFQSHRNMSMAIRRTSAGGPDEVDLAGAASRYHPYGHAVTANITHYSSASSPVPYAAPVERATSVLGNAIDGGAPEGSYPMNSQPYASVPNNSYYAEDQDEYVGGSYDVPEVIYDGAHYNTAQPHP
ncbi:STE-like transcription factor [Rhizoctonia solani AG-3 Rhs1AP]|uniref:STE-like transcription factor n=2 Tax=Rhizoctonia solani AG-3 TaxID=1086053 RepID=A0A074RWW5_9AGAM|nr:STE-like transcription factor [Rhizoctonia solani AG-3 Rhs1AP]KEP51601.1 STE-like transcription factor [Rhizoctonia solani 123E]